MLFRLERTFGARAILYFGTWFDAVRGLEAFFVLADMLLFGVAVGLLFQLLGVPVAPASELMSDPSAGDAAPSSVEEREMRCGVGDC